MDLDFNKNEDIMKQALSQLRNRYQKISLGGGLKSIEKQHEKKKLTARERISYLLDAGQTLFEIGAFAGYEMYEEYGGCPAGGTVAGIGYVSGRQCVILANDQTVKAGAWFPITGKKNLRLQEIAMENHLPLIYIVDSAGVFLPLQDEIFPDKEHFGRIFRNNARISAMGITQLSVVMGPCVAGGAYLPIMSDETIMAEGNGSIFLAGPYLVKAAIGETTDAETLGGAVTHTSISGIADYKFKTEAECLDQVKKIMSTLGRCQTAGFDRIGSHQPLKDPGDLYGLMPAESSRPYDMMEIIHRLVDAPGLQSYKEDYGKTIICGYARIDGWAVGVVANQRTVVKTKKGEVQLGGVIYNDSADKSARFIMNCNQKKIPLLFLQDVTGFMVGTRSEHAGIIKDGAKMVNAVANSVVPKFTVILGNSYGAGNYAMCGKAYDPRLILAWPTAKIAVMGGDQAAKTLLQIQVASLQSQGKQIDPAEEKKLLDEIRSRYEKQSSPYYAAARLWVDAIIDPLETRKLISEGIRAADQNPDIPVFKNRSLSGITPFIYNKNQGLQEPVIMYTDGASRGNPGPGGFGTILMWKGHARELFGGFKRTTNNRMELMAVIAGLEALKKESVFLKIYSDSQYVVNSVEKGWLKNWINTDFKGGKKNKDLWLRYANLAVKHHIQFHWVKGHGSNPYNNRCDELATTAADNPPLKEDEGFEG